MVEESFLMQTKLNLPESGKVGFSAPSNIALVKYWGKMAHQIPANPSISFTLDACKTTTSLEFQKLEAARDNFSFELLFEGNKKESFKPKITAFFERIFPYLPFLKSYHFKIETSNSFPHSSGIASSASGMAALALCLLSIENEADQTMDTEKFNRKASFLARLGSGSASRSIEGPLVQWGKTTSIENSSDLFAIKYPFELHDNFKNYHDTILLVDKGEKSVSSTAGHQLMEGHPFAKNRFDQAHRNLAQLQDIFAVGDLKAFVEIVESEALTLHAMMMTSRPYYLLMKPNTLKIIELIWRYRADTGIPVCFTLDAGANVHVLYPEHEKENVFAFIKGELIAYCQGGQYLCDRIGKGAKLLSKP